MDDVFGQRFQLNDLQATPALSWLGLAGTVASLLGVARVAMRRRRNR